VIGNSIEEGRIGACFVEMSGGHGLGNGSLLHQRALMEGPMVVWLYFIDASNIRHLERVPSGEVMIIWAVKIKAAGEGGRKLWVCHTLINDMSGRNWCAWVMDPEKIPHKFLCMEG
jgi:hypothetical protein